MLLAADTSAATSAWHNSGYPLDVNYDNQITPRDALLMINDLLAHGSHADVSDKPPRRPQPWSGWRLGQQIAPPGAVDVNGDGKVTPAMSSRRSTNLRLPNPNAIVDYSLETEDLSGNPISTVTVGQDSTGDVRQGLESPAATHGGVFAGFANVAYDSNRDNSRDRDDR